MKELEQENLTYRRTMSVATALHWKQLEEDGANMVPVLVEGGEVKSIGYRVKVEGFKVPPGAVKK